MSTASLPRDLLMPPSPDGMGRGLALAVAAHVALVAALAFGVHWRASPPAAAEAELWAAVPQAAAPRAVAPEPPAPQVQQPPPAPPPQPEPAPTPAVPDPQIAIEKARREALKKEQADKEQARRDEQKRLQAQRDKDDAERKKAEKAEKAEQAERTRREDAKLAALREANLKRLMGQAGATSDAPSPGTAAQSSGPSASYAGRIKARIKPNIVFTDVIDGNPLATVEVKLAPDGTIVGKRLVKSSGSKSWDDAVLRAIEKTDMLPRDIDGRVPPPFEIDFRPRD